MLRPVKRTRLYEDVLAQIEHFIRRRGLCPGDRLSSERELAATLGIGRASVREALRTLGSMGLIEVRSGQGVFLHNISPNPYLFSISESLSFLLDVRDDALLELWEVRRGLEEKIVFLAACRMSEKDIGELRTLTGYEVSKNLFRGVCPIGDQISLQAHRSGGEHSPVDALGGDSRSHRAKPAADHRGPRSI